MTPYEHIQIFSRLVINNQLLTDDQKVMALSNVTILIMRLLSPDSPGEHKILQFKKILDDAITDIQLFNSNPN